MNEFTPYPGWRLHSRQEKQYMGTLHFYERWVHDRSKSGIIFLSTVKDDRVVYIAEGYGIGTINPKTFTERGGMAPIQRSVQFTVEAGQAALLDIMKENAQLWGKPKGGNDSHGTSEVV